MPVLAPFPNAPISEAVIDIRFSSESALPFEKLESFVKAVKSDYPKAKKSGEIRTEVKADFGAIDTPEVTHASTAHPSGYFCTSADGKQIVQPRINSFVFSRLRPYERWETFKSEAQRLFALYTEIYGHRTIERIAVRTINRLDIPQPAGDLKEWIRTGPEVSPSLPQGLSGFFLQLHQPYEDIKSLCIINETLVPPEVPDTACIILDIDLFRTEELPQDHQALWALFDELRVKKDDIFIGCITDKMKEQFDNGSPN